jgi:hypothetical protein
VHENYKLPFKERAPNEHVVRGKKDISEDSRFIIAR